MRLQCSRPVDVILNSRQLLELLRDGEETAATEVFDRYVARLVALAASRIGPKIRQRVDAEDVVQSAYRSFFVHAEAGDYTLTNSGDLWRLLAKITLHKLYGQIEKQQAEKRNVDREDRDEVSIAEKQTPEPTPVEAIAVAELLQVAMAKLAPAEREVIAASLQGQTVEEIGGAMDKSQRTVRRHLATAKQKIEQCLLDRGSEEPAQIVVTSAEAPLAYSAYVLEELRGSGGMGKVYRAREKSTGDIVAIKALHKTRQRERPKLPALYVRSYWQFQMRHSKCS